MPEWLLKEENYIPVGDRDFFINKSIMSILNLLSRIKAQGYYKEGKLKVNSTLKVVLTFLLIVLLSLSRSFQFVLIINVYLIFSLSLMDVKVILKIFELSIIVAVFTFIILIPSTLWGNGVSSVILCSKVFASVMAVNILSYSTRWNKITDAFKFFFLPDLFIFVLDITIKYIVLLGEFSINMLYALKLRSVGRNSRKYNSISGIAGTLFIKSKEMAEDMYSAMECRGFTGEYKLKRSYKLSIADPFYVIINIGLIAIFVYFGR